MSQENIVSTLESMGLSHWDAKLYLLLAKKGPLTAREVSKSLKMPKPTLYLALKNLQKKGIATSTLEHPAKFAATPFEEVLDLFVKTKIVETKRIQQSKEKILSDWKSILIADQNESSARFTVIEGKNTIYSKIQQMMLETKKQLSFITTVSDLVRADQFGLFDAAFSRPLKGRIQLKLITDLSEQNVKIWKSFLKRKPTANVSFEGRTPDLGLRSLIHLVIKDGEEAMFFLNPLATASEVDKDEICLWTNCKVLVDSFQSMFEDLWSKSTDIEMRISELETGKPTSKTCIIYDAKDAEKKYYEELNSATKEVLMMTSSKGLIAFLKREPLVKQWSKKGVCVKIMAPIVRENIEAVHQLLRGFEVKHVPAVYLESVLIDGQHFFQFKNSPPDRENLGASRCFGNIFYTTDHEYVRKAENMFNDIWRNARSPLAVPLEIFSYPSWSKTKLISDGKRQRPYNLVSSTIIERENPLGTLTEKDLLNKIINARRVIVKNPSTEVLRYYGCSGMAVILPPAHFKLPNMAISAWHFNDQSSFGAEDWLWVYLELPTPRGLDYVPVAYIHNNQDPKVVAFRKPLFSGSPIDLQVMKKEELDMRLHGNTLLAAWTVPISLVGSKYVLPPSCILFEGEGEAKTFGSVQSFGGRRQEIEWNRLEASVTFLHQSSKYSGPSTDGFLDREIIWTSIPTTDG